MTRKKHTHQTKSEAAAELAAVKNGATNGHAEVADDVPPSVEGRLRRLLQEAESVARKRLHGTRVEVLFDSVPQRLEQQLDALLDRLGLVRKSRIGAEPFARASTPANDAPLAEPHVA